MVNVGGHDDATVNNVLSGSASYVIQAGSVGPVTIKTVAAPPGIVPRQAPLPPDPFVDRDPEIALIEELARRPAAGRPVVAAVRGMQGVGKTAVLAVGAARLRERFPDGILHAALGPVRDRGDGALSDVVARLLRALGAADDWIPADFAGRVGLWRSMTADSRLLLLLDDVAYEAHVEALLPNSGNSMVLVAGNRTLEGLRTVGATDIHLSVLDQAHSVELLRRLCDDGRIADHPEQSRVLAELCGGLPLVLGAVGARLALHPVWPVSRLVDELSGGPDAFDGLAGRIQRVFDVVYDDLSETTARVYRMLGLLVGPHFTAEVIAAMADLTGQQARRVLTELVELNVLDELADDEFGLHPVIRLHALRRSQDEDSPEQRVEILRRALRWWLLGAVAADVAVTGWERLRVTDPRSTLGAGDVRMPSRPAGLDWLEREHDNLVGLLRAAVDLEWYADAGQLFEALFAYYDNRKPLAAWIMAGELAVTAAERSGDRAVEARARCQLAKGLRENERFAEAHAQLTRARELAREVDERLYASTLDFTGNVHYVQGEYPTALDYFRRALEINERLGRPRGTALQRWFCGRTLARLGRVDEALDVLTRAHAEMSAADGESMVPRIGLSLAEVLLGADRIDEARDAAGAALKSAKESRLTAIEADALEVLARIARRAGDVTAERSYLDRAEIVYGTMGSPRAARIHARRSGS